MHSVMNTTTYNALVSVLAVGVVVTLLLAVGYLIAAIAGWKGPHRKKRLVRFAILVAALPFFVIAQQLLLWRVFLPSLALRKHVSIKCELMQVRSCIPVTQHLRLLLRKRVVGRLISKINAEKLC